MLSAFIIHMHNNNMMRIAAAAADMPLGRRLALGAGDFGFNLYWQSASLFLLYFYTDVVGLPAESAGALYMAALVWDAALDPVIGAMADRTRSRLGRYRPYLLLGGIPLGLTFTLMLAFSGAQDRITVALTVVLHFGFRTLYALVSIPYAAMFARVTRDARIRADMAAIRIVFATSAAVAVAVLTLPLVDAMSRPDAPRRGWIALGLIYAAVATLLLMLAAWAARDHDEADVAAVPVLALSLRLRALLRNRALLLLVTALMLNAGCGTFFGKNLLYYFKYVAGRADLGGYALGFSALVVTLSVPLFAWLGRRYGKREVWLIGAVPALTGLLLWHFLPVDAVNWRFFALGVGALGSAATAVSFWSMLPDTVEYGEWISGVRNESLVFGVAVLGQKVALGIAAGLLGAALTQVGYQANATQTPETLNGLRQLMFWIPFAGTAVAAVLISRYPVSLGAHARIVADIRTRQQDAASWVDR